MHTDCHLVLSDKPGRVGVDVLLQIMAAKENPADASTMISGDGGELRLKWKLDIDRIEEGALKVLKHVRPRWSADRVGFRVSH